MLVYLRDILWNALGVLLIVFGGVYFTVKSGFVQFKVKDNLQSISKALCREGGFAAMATALGGTVGAGSVVGVAVGIAAGGAGSIFWMWISGLLGMALRYTETKYALSDRIRHKGKYIGGAMVSLSRLGCHRMSRLFCVAAIIVSLGTGSMTQSGAASASLEVYGVNKYALGALIALAVLGVVVFGKSAVLKADAVIVPICCGTYILLLMPIIFCHIDKLPKVLGEIFASAFGFDSVTGGFAAFALARAVREGVTRGTFSTECGMGSAPLCYCGVQDFDIESKAKLGIAEIFTDTFIISTPTALCLLCGGYSSSVQMMGAFYGSFGKAIICVLVCVFAIAAMLGWYYYAGVCIEFLSDKKSLCRIYTALSVASAFAGAVLPQNAVWAIADIANLFMLLPNMYMLFVKVKKHE